MIRGFLFDLGGTLLGFRGLTEEDLFRIGAERSYRLLREKEAFQTDFGTYYRRISRAFLHRWLWAVVTGREIVPRRLFQRMARRLDIDGGPDLWTEVEMEWHVAVRENVHLIDGGIDLLEALKARGMRLGVTSNVVWRRDFVLEQLEGLGILPYFDSLTFSSDLGYRKPHRRIYLQALRGLGLPRSQVAFVGNQHREDVRGPERLGMRAIHISRNSPPSRFLAARHKARDLAEVKEIALRWCSPQ